MAPGVGIDVGGVDRERQSHLEAGDPRLLTIALSLLVLMPWNLPLWWQLRRLRRAIEVDCDSRVLRFTMPRIDNSVAEQIETNLAAKTQSQTASPGTEAAVRRMIAGHEAGIPDYTMMSPQLGKLVREQLPHTTSLFKQLGPLQSVEFKGVGTQGWDIYDVKFANGIAQYRIVLSDDLIVTGALFQTGP